MKITITGEHAGKSATIATWEYVSEVFTDKDTSIDVEDEIMAVLQQQMRHYFHMVAKNEK